MNKPVSQEKKDKKANAIVVVAKDLFLKDGIDDVKMTDIADKCLLGVATLYRYFNVKRTIVLASGIMIWEEKYQEFLSIEKDNNNKNRNGIDSLKKLLFHFYDIYKVDKNFFVFLRQFDSFCVKERINSSYLSSYDAELMKIKDIFFSCAEKGVKDGTIRSDIDFSLAYFSFTKAAIGLCQKLISEGRILNSDQEEDSDKQVEILFNLIFSYFKKA